MFGQEVVAKARKSYDYWCKICEQFLMGNGSIVTPYRCNCGEYKYSFELRQYVHPKEER